MAWTFGKANLSEKRKIWAGAIVLALLPVFCAILRCMLDGKTLTDLYLPACTWNDELFYYKLTEGVLSFGYPQGYFGFNESHGMLLSFAAWSPVLLLHWVAWGLLFGWNLLSPIWANLACLSIALLVFGLVTKPNKWQIAMMALFYLAFTPITRFSLSCIPEAEIFSLFILFLSVTISCEQKYKGYKIVILFALMALLTWMRPYLLLLILTPTWLWWKKNVNGRRIIEEAKAETYVGQGDEKKRTLIRRDRIIVILVSSFVAGVTVLVYYLINHFFSAPYLTDLFYTDWVEAYFQKGLFGGLKYTIWKLYSSLTFMRRIMIQNLCGYEAFSAAGLYYFVFIVFLLLLIGRILWKRKRSELLEVQITLCMLGFFVADLLMYRIQEGGRHTLVYLTGCILLFPLFMKTRRETSIVGLLIAMFFLVFIGRGDIPYEFDLPYATGEYKADLQNLEKQLRETMMLSENAPSYENTIIWSLWDQVDGETVTVDYGAYYVVPVGFGINLCDGGYMDANLENLKSRYIGTVPDGLIEQRCIECGGKLIGQCERLVVYDMNQ